MGWSNWGGSWQGGQREFLAPEGANGETGWICPCVGEENLGSFLKCLDAAAPVALLCQGELPESGIPLLPGEHLGGGTWGCPHF